MVHLLSLRRLSRSRCAATSNICTHSRWDVRTTSSLRPKAEPAASAGDEHLIRLTQLRTDELAGRAPNADLHPACR
jgi:hypothetical protein